jgi:hypothetical protein
MKAVTKYYIFRSNSIFFQFILLGHDSSFVYSIFQIKRVRLCFYINNITRVAVEKKITMIALHALQQKKSITKKAMLTLLSCIIIHRVFSIGIIKFNIRFHIVITNIKV